MAEATARRWSRLDGVLATILERPLARRVVRDSRHTVPIRIIAVWNADGSQQARFNATATSALVMPAFTGARASFPGGLALRDGGRVIAVLFDPKSLALGHATLVAQKDHGALFAPVPGWP